MNRLGHALAHLGADVYLPEAFPLYVGVLANTWGLRMAALALAKSLTHLAQQGVGEVSLAGHSAGGLIAMLCLASPLTYQTPRTPRTRSIITMATPFRGIPASRLLRPWLPVGRDLAPCAAILDEARRQAWRVGLTLVAGSDAIVPERCQRLDGEANARSVLMPHFQHGDFIIGDDDKIAATAALIWQEMTCPTPAPATGLRGTAAPPPRISQQYTDGRPPG